MEWLWVLIAVLLALLVSAWRLARRSGRSAPGRPEMDPVRRQRIEEEIRRRHGRSGPTVDGGQHLR